MTAPIAAAYMGISTPTFLGRFRPIAVKEGGNVLWARAQLDKVIAEQFGIAVVPLPIIAETPSDYDMWKAEDQRNAAGDAMLERVKARLAQIEKPTPRNRRK